MRNMSSLFYTEKINFLTNITPIQEQKDLMKCAVADIKTCLNEAISKEYGQHPHFMTQGSAGYKTQNSPCYSTQEIDYDLGCYLPFSDIQESGKPKKAATIYYAAVDAVLEQLAHTNHWYGINKDKKTCARVLVSSKLHIDIPLYSVPDSAFHTIHDKGIESRKSLNLSEGKSVIEEESWDDFKFDNILLGKRDGTWQKSDPRKINLFFTDSFEKKGEQLRRLCRYLKAWRDFKWKKGGPKSIYLMCLADDLYIADNNLGDDLALLDLMSKIPDRLNTPVINKAENETLNMQEEADIALLKEYATSFSHDLRKALSDETIYDEEACKLIQYNLGDRFPLVSIIRHERERTIEYVRRIPVSKDTESKPLIRTRAG